MKPITLFIALSLAVASASAQIQLPQTETIQIDGYAARVNDKVITRGDVVNVLSPMLPGLYQRYKDKNLEVELEKAFKQARNELVERALIMEAFKKRGGEIPDQYVNDEIDRIISTRFKGDRVQFEQSLIDQKMTRAEYTETLRERLSVGSMFSEEVTRRVRITPEQVRSAYDDNKEKYLIREKVKYSVILLNKGVTEEDQAVKRKEAEGVRQRLVDGDDFAEVARSVSEGGRASEGGAFPWMQPKDIDPELAETINTLPVGELSEIIETDAEFYIVRLDARRQAGEKSFDDVRKELKEALVKAEKARLKKRWIARLKEENYVRLYD